MGLSMVGSHQEATLCEDKPSIPVTRPRSKQKILSFEWHANSCTCGLYYFCMTLHSGIVHIFNFSITLLRWHWFLWLVFYLTFHPMCSLCPGSLPADGVRKTTPPLTTHLFSNHSLSSAWLMTFLGGSENHVFLIFAFWGNGLNILRRIG